MLGHALPGNDRRWVCQDRGVSWFLLLKTVHVLSATVGVGANVSYGVWITQGDKQPNHLLFALRGIEKLEQRVANPAYGLLLLTGLIMGLTQYSVSNTWILIGLVGFIVVAGLSTAVFAPALRRQIAAAETEGAAAEAYKRAAATARGVGMFLVIDPRLPR